MGAGNGAQVLWKNSQQALQRQENSQLVKSQQFFSNYQILFKANKADGPVFFKKPGLTNHEQAVHSTPARPLHSHLHALLEFLPWPLPVMDHYDVELYAEINPFFS